MKRYPWNRFDYDGWGMDDGRVVFDPSPGPFVGRGPRGYERDDARILEEVCDALTRSEVVDATDIEVRCEVGEVTLRGMVDSRRQKREAQHLAALISGVRDVHNLLHTRHVPGHGLIADRAEDIDDQRSQLLRG